MTKTLKKKGLLEAAQIQLINHWADIVGDDLALQSKPLRLKNGILTIAAPSGAALILQHQSSELIAKANELLEHEAVKRIQFIQRAL